MFTVTKVRTVVFGLEVDASSFPESSLLFVELPTDFGWSSGDAVESLCVGQPDNGQGSTEQQPLKPLEAQV